MRHFNKIFITTTGAVPSIYFSDVPDPFYSNHPLTDFEITFTGNYLSIHNTVAHFMASSIFKDALKNNYIIAYNEFNEEIDSFLDKFIDFQIPSLSNGQTLSWDTDTQSFIPVSIESITGSDRFLKYTLTNILDITIEHTFNREANVKIFENGSEVECYITYPDNLSNLKVRIQSNQPINGFAILT